MAKIFFSSYDHETYQNCWYGVSEYYAKVSSEKIEWKVTILWKNRQKIRFY